MKLLRYGMLGSEKPGCLDANGNIRDLSSVMSDISGSELSCDKLNQLRQLEINSLPLAQQGSRIGACVQPVGKLICIGLNYLDHAKEAGLVAPAEPILFLKATSSICGANDDLILPAGSTHTDWEVELGVVIGTTAKNISEKEAHNFIAGYTIVNDTSEREWQFKTSQWTRGKSCDSFGPIGPWLVTSDEVINPQKLNMWCEVDGHRYQDGSTAQMVFSIEYIVSYLSRIFTLHPGDIISTGTPSGSGIGQKPHPIYLKPGQIVTLGIEGLGVQHHKAVPE